MDARKYPDLLHWQYELLYLGEDDLNRTGLMEAVGTHTDHRQIGLGRAIVRFAAHHMATAGGMEYATVANSESNAASSALYRSAGFEPWHAIDGYTKPIG